MKQSSTGTLDLVEGSTGMAAYAWQHGDEGVGVGELMGRKFWWQKKNLADQEIGWDLGIIISNGKDFHC